ncbi:MAG: hypothetical protein HC831_06725 [Chloroflexia bacterium]|nr:hypothetical protein [Chloroflexia bacterium]
MEFKEIDNLIEKYLAGETSLNEEKLIKKYLEENEELPEKYHQMKQMFNYFGDAYKEESTLKLDSIIVNKKPASKTRKITLWAMAACIALLIAVFVFNTDRNEQRVYAYIDGKPITDKDVAMAETQKALFLISNKLNEGTVNLNHLKEFSKAEEILRTN